MDVSAAVEEDPFPSAPFVDIQDVYSPKLVNIIINVMNWCTLLTIIIMPGYIYIILKKSPKIMISFKRLLLCFIGSTIIFEFSMMALKPLLLLPILATYPVGLLSPMNVQWALGLLCLIGFSLPCMVDFLLAILAQRYFTLIQASIKPWKPKAFYFFQILTNLILSSFSCGFIIADTPPEDVTLRFLRIHISNSSDFLQFQPSLIASNHSDRIKSLGFFCFCGIFNVSRFILFSYFLYKNLNLFKSSGNSNNFLMSLQTRRQHQMLIKVVCAQLFGIFIFLTLPFITIICLVQFPNVIVNASKIWYFLLLILSNFVFYDCILTIYFINPYRNYVIQQLCCCSCFCCYWFKPKKIKQQSYSISAAKNDKNL